MGGIYTSNIHTVLLDKDIASRHAPVIHSSGIPNGPPVTDGIQHGTGTPRSCPSGTPSSGPTHPDQIYSALEEDNSTPGLVRLVDAHSEDAHSEATTLGALIHSEYHLELVVKTIFC